MSLGWRVRIPLPDPTKLSTPMEKSASIRKIATALAVFHTKIGTIKKDTVNTAFNSKYASLSTILENIAKPLEEAGLVITQWPSGADGLETMLLHSASGEFMSSTFTMKQVTDAPTDAGSRIKYMRRYSLGAVLSLNIEDEKPTSKKEADGGALVPDENAEWLTEEAFHAYIRKINAGDKDAFADACTRWKISDQARAELKKAHDNIPKAVQTMKP